VPAGTALRYQVQTLNDPVFEASDPRAWRNECVDPASTARLGDILSEWKDDYAQLGLIGQMNGKEPVHCESRGEDYKVTAHRSLLPTAVWLTLSSSGPAGADAELWMAR
jgi:hypothetical protein